MYLEEFLPLECLPSFNVFRAAQAQIIWKNSDGGELVSVEKHGYCLPLYGDASLSNADALTFRAERYGGHGIGTNGGGARCGVYGSLQIKGIGQNPVVGMGSNFFHTYGGASLNEATVEAIWGEIFHNILPYGSARVRGIISTGERVPLVLPKQGKEATTPRALIIRDAVLRPAHYMRAPYFAPLNSSVIHSSDTLRTQSAIASLPRTLAHIFDDGPGCIEDVGYVDERLRRLLRRYGRQLAAARIKRCMHGSLLASNIALDGRWLDFGTTTALPTWAHFVSPNGPDFLEEELMLHPAIVELQFYLKKYLKKEYGAKLGTSTELYKCIQTSLLDALPAEFATLVGIPVHSISALPAHALSEAYDAFVKVVLYKNTRRFVMMSDNSQESFVPFGVTGAHDMLKILRTLATSESASTADRALEDLIRQPLLREKLARCYHALRDGYINKMEPSRKAVAIAFCRVNAFRFTSNLLSLYRPYLYEQIANTIDGGYPIEKFIADSLIQAKLFMFNDHDGKIDLSFILGADAAIDCVNGLVINGNVADPAIATEGLKKIFEHSESTDTLKRYES